MPLLVALDQEMELSLKSSARLVAVKGFQKGVLFVVPNAGRMKAVRQEVGESGFADPERAFDGDKARSFVVLRHRIMDSLSP